MIVRENLNRGMRFAVAVIMSVSGTFQMLVGHRFLGVAMCAAGALLAIAVLHRIPAGSNVTIARHGWSDHRWLFLFPLVGTTAALLIGFAPTNRMDWISLGAMVSMLTVLSWVAPLMVLHLRYRADTEERDPHQPASF